MAEPQESSTSLEVALSTTNPRSNLAHYPFLYRNSNGVWQRTETRVEQDTVYANGVFLADWHIGLRRSTDGFSWSDLDTPSWITELTDRHTVDSLQSDGTAFWLTIHYYEENNSSQSVSRYVTARSDDGLSWQVISSELQPEFYNLISFKNQIYFQDGWDFRRINSSDYSSKETIATYNNGFQVAKTKELIGLLPRDDGGVHTEIRVSSDGDSWQSHTTPISGYINLTASDDAFYLYGDTVWKSTNGKDWVKELPYPAKVTTSGSKVVFYADDLTFIEKVNRDLTIESANVADKDYGVGDSVSISITLKNQSSEKISWNSDSAIRFAFLKDTNRWARSAIESGFDGSAPLTFSSLAANESRTLQTTTRIPEGIDPNRYYLSVFLENDLIGKDGNKTNDYLISSESTSINIPSRSLTLGDPENGFVEGPIGNSTFAWKDRIALRAIPDFGYVFENWNGDFPYAEAYLLLTLDNDTSLEPEFTSRTYSVSLDVQGRGQITGLPNSNTFQHGQELNLSATPEEGWVFLGWVGFGNQNSNAFKAKVGRNLVVNAKFGRTYATWTEAHLSGSESEKALFADHDNDGTTNIERFAFGLDFEDQRSASDLGFRIENQRLVLRYALYAGLFEVDASLVWSLDGTNWRSDSLSNIIVSTTSDLDIYEASLPINEQVPVVLLKLRLRENELSF